MAKIALQPAATGSAVTHYDHTIEHPRSLTELRPFVSSTFYDRLQREYPEGRTPIWGAVEGNRSTFERLSRDDVVLFYRDQEFISRARVTLLLPDADRLANHLWDPDPKAGSYRHVFFLRDVENVRIPWSVVRDYLDYKPSYYLRRLTVLDETQSAGLFPILSEFDPSLRTREASARDPVEKSGAEAAEDSLERGQGFQSSAAVRKALEDRSMALAEEYFRKHDFDVEDVSANHPYDLKCERASDGLVVHVEVKGTQTDGKEVILTANEVDFARRHADRMILCVVHSMEIEETADGGVRARGGVRRMNIPWDVEAGDLRPINYRYRVP